MKKIAQLILWLSLILMMMALCCCSTPTASNQDCLEYPKGGSAMGGVYRRLTTEDRKIAGEYFNRLHKFFSMPQFCQPKGE